MDYLIEYVARGFYTMLTISLPCVLVAASIGLVVGILQAVTQVQEQTIVAAPKIIGVFLTIVILGSFNIKNMNDFITEGLNIAFNIVPKSDNYVLPSDYYHHTKPFAGEMNDKIKEGKGNTKQLLEHPGKIPWAEASEKSRFTPADRTANPMPNFIEINKILGR